jgi:NAD(P)-dependent dehydrogenase (short-subunit alcohol dehydrogenase family)
MVLMHHGIFSFGETARESYERMIALVTRAEEYLARHGAWELRRPARPQPRPVARGEIATLRAAVSRAAGSPLVLAVHDDDRSLAFARREDAARISQQGPATPDHVIRTKRVPMLGRDVDAYVAGYREYFQRNAPSAREPKTMLDPAPRVILDAELGLVTTGRSARDASVVADVYRHTMDIIERATALGGWRALGERELFEVEYWDLEQAKLRAGGAPPPMSGEVALVTGAASGIGKAVAASLLARGAAVAGLDLSPAVEHAQRGAAWLGVPCDLTDAGALDAALDRAVRAFGGIDMLVLNAGVFPASRRIDGLADGEWRRVFEVNLDANLRLLREAQPLLTRAPRGGRVVVVGSRNVPAPGPGAAAYSASKAALTQLARVAALEWAESGVRVNMVHPDAVFDTGIWTPEVLEARARSYGMTVDQYRTRNLLRTEVRSADVAELVAELCGPLFAKTTGAQIPIDGGNDRVI